ncbi:hypothetical protein BGX28_002625 [Mortierella sp. GBA30]|nr:hypothetical protein BGX28_002625 [Mortierella sp. GBA30]
MTAGRRTSPVPQMSCIGGNACGEFEPDVVQCTNTGFDGSDVQWKCQADLPDNLRFGQLDVYCEGYNYPEDPYVLKGSCGLEYKLYYTNARYSQEGSWKNPNVSHWASKAKRHSWIETVYLWVWIGVVGFILYAFLRNCFQRPMGGRGDAPPPYRASGGGGGGGGWGRGWGTNHPYKSEDGSSEGFRPGFWSGLGLGGLATYLATNRNRERDYAHRPAYMSTGSGWGTSYSPSSSTSPYGSYSGGYAGPSSSSSSSSPSSSRPTRTATGFGGTRRR